MFQIEDGFKAVKEKKINREREEIRFKYHSEVETYSAVNAKVMENLDEFRRNLVHQAPEILREIILFGGCTLIADEHLPKET